MKCKKLTAALAALLALVGLACIGHKAHCHCKECEKED